MTTPNQSPATLDNAPGKPPIEIWLQWNGDAEPDSATKPEEVTWAQHPVFAHDVRYVIATPSPSLPDDGAKGTLTIKRKVGQSVTIGESIVVTINHVDGGQVSLSISAPKSVPITRNELFDQRQEAGKQNGV